MNYLATDHQRIIHRLKIAYGQLGKVISMAQEQRNWKDVLYQIRAVQMCLRSTYILIAFDHLNKSSQGLNPEKSISFTKDLKETLNTLKK